MPTIFKIYLCSLVTGGVLETLMAAKWTNEASLHPLFVNKTIRTNIQYCSVSYTFNIFNCIAVFIEISSLPSFSITAFLFSLCWLCSSRQLHTLKILRFLQNCPITPRNHPFNLCQPPSTLENRQYGFSFFFFLCGTKLWFLWVKRCPCSRMQEASLAFPFMDLPTL